MKATHILWDVDYPDELDALPSEMEFPQDIDPEDIADYLSDQTGYCHKGYVLEDD